MVYNFFDKRTSGSGIKNDNISSKELAEELRKSVIRKIKKRKVHSFFIDNIWGANLADTQLINKFNKRIISFYCVLLTFIANMHGFLL